MGSQVPNRDRSDACHSVFQSIDDLVLALMPVVHSVAWLLAYLDFTVGGRSPAVPQVQ